MQEAKTFLQLREWIEKGDSERTDGIHASDLLDPRLAFFRKKNPKAASERQVYFYAIGRVLHMLVLSAVRGETDISKSDIGTGSVLDIHYSMDHKVDGHPVELKTHRGLREPKPDQIQEQFGHYLEQLAIYMVAENKLIGELWVLFINLLNDGGRTFPELRCYKVEMNEEQFYATEQEIVQTRDVLVEALETNDPTQLPLCRQWLCGDACGYWKACQPQGRYPAKVKKLWTA